MNKFLIGSAFAALAIAAPVSAQQLPPAVIAVVDVQRILAQCTACVAANAALRTQEQQIQARATQLSTPLQAEAQTLQTAVNAAGGNPDAALQARIHTFETQRQAAREEIQGRQETLQRNRNFVLQQIGARLNPIVNQVAQQRGATIAVDAGSTIWNAPTLEVTDGVLALLNTQLPSVSTVAPPPTPAPASAPGTRPATAPATTPPATPPRPRPQGR
jgi:Skp family chaperone for outer membrane proteins